ncbi:hypothetical protein ACFLQ2_01850 [archaeon]
MKRIAVMLLLLLAVAAAEEVSLNRAATLAVVEYPDLQVAPQSTPEQLAVTETGSYWIVEFDQVWVPVTSEGAVLKEQEEEIIAAYKVHYALQTVSGQRETNQYPTAEEDTLTLLLGDVENKETYLVSYKAQLPTELQDEADSLVTAAQGLKAAIQSSRSSIVALKATETSLFSSRASYSDFGSWRTEFGAMLDSLGAVAETGYAYDDGRTEFNLAATAFVESSNNTAQKQLVQAFTGGIAISNIPGSLPGLESTVSQWKSNWLDVQLTDEKIGENAGSVYILYHEFYSGETVTVLRQEAYSKVQALAVTVPLILGDLTQCEDKLTPREQTQLNDLDEAYTKATDAYNEGRGCETALDDECARTAYQNAVSYSEDAAALEGELGGADCPSATPTPQPNILGDFLGSVWGIAFIGLVVLLVGLYWWNNRKKEETYDEGEYVPDW